MTMHHIIGTIFRQFVQIPTRASLSPIGRFYKNTDAFRHDDGRWQGWPFCNGELMKWIWKEAL